MKKIRILSNAVILSATMASCFGMEKVDTPKVVVVEKTSSKSGISAVLAKYDIKKEGFKIEDALNDVQVYLEGLSKKGATLNGAVSKYAASVSALAVKTAVSKVKLFMEEYLTDLAEKAESKDEAIKAVSAVIATSNTIVSNDVFKTQMDSLLDKESDLMDSIDTHFCVQENTLALQRYNSDQQAIVKAKQDLKALKGAYRDLSDLLSGALHDGAAERQARLQELLKQKTKLAGKLDELSLFIEQNTQGIQ